MTKIETRNDKLRDADDKLQQAVSEIVCGDEWKRILRPSTVGLASRPCDLDATA